ncbi:MAG TPA: fumarate hydratase [Chromatiaceae bacterium]|nr:fumarate hydratase [Chromatiaceae bacterium]
MPTEYQLRTPLSESDVRKLRVGDVVYITGTMVTARDQAHRRALELLERGERLPVNLEGLVVYHCGPVVKKEDDTWVVLAAGPTTSRRMESVEADFIRRTGVRMIVGKGGLGPRTAEACKDFGAVYAVFTGGAAVVAARLIKRVKEVHWLDLGVPEALWVLEVERFGPLVVVIDATGKNLYDDVVMPKAKRVYEEEILPNL